MQRPDGDPRSLDYLLDRDDQSEGGVDVRLQVLLSTERMRREGHGAVEIVTSNAHYLCWTPAQMMAHHTVNGCNLQAGDLIGTGTISGPTTEELGSMLELSNAGARPIALPNSDSRSFLRHGDEVIFRGRCERE